MQNTGLLFAIIFSLVTLLFLSKILEGIWNYRIKNKIIDKNSDEALAREILFQQPQKPAHEAFKYFCIIFFAGMGIFVSANFEPEPNRQIGMATMIASMGFMVYFIYLRFSK